MSIYYQYSVVNQFFCPKIEIKSPEFKRISGFLSMFFCTFAHYAILSISQPRWLCLALSAISLTAGTGNWAIREPVLPSTILISCNPLLLSYVDDTEKLFLAITLITVVTRFVYLVHQCCCDQEHSTAHHSAALVAILLSVA